MRVTSLLYGTDLAIGALERAEQAPRMMASFAELHDRTKPLLLPNAWDAASARIFEEAGFPAAATSSAGVAYSLGYSDGGAAPVDEVIAAIARIARSVAIPLTADIEDGWSDDVDALLRVVERVRGAGAVGINLEDWDGRAGDLRPLEVAARRVAAVKERFRSDMFVNARTDVYLQNVGAAERRREATVERLRAFVRAGADGVFVPGIADAETIGALTAAVVAPLNVLAGPRTPPLAQLATLGVARVSLGSWPMRHAMGATRELARQLRSPDPFAFTREKSIVPFTEANELFSAGARPRSAR